MGHEEETTQKTTAHPIPGRLPPSFASGKIIVSLNGGGFPAFFVSR
jgi:hypothetical protein